VADATILELNQARWDREVPGLAVPLLAVFWAEWCLPCHTLLPRVGEAAHRWAGKVRVATVDAERSPALVERFGIVGLPTVLILRNGSEQVRRVGLISPENLDRLVEQTTGERAG
jgi:thioredoxin-like negative regulator of GroEL